MHSSSIITLTFRPPVRLMRKSLFLCTFLLSLFSVIHSGCSEDDGPTQPAVTETDARLLFLKPAAGDVTIQSIDPTTGNVTDVVAGDMSAPVGGNRIAMAVSDSNDDDHIDVIDIRTGQIVESFARRFGEWVVSPTVAISPDGSKVAYTGVSTDGGEWSYRMVIQDVANPDDFIILPTGSSRGSFARFSPDGTRIAFYSRHGDIDRQGNLNIVNLDGTGLRSLVDAGEVPQDGTALMDWSPDGNSISYVSWDIRVSVVPALYVIDVNSGYRRKLVDDGIFPAWSPDGTKILYTDVAPQLTEDFLPSLHLYIINSDGTGKKELRSGVGTYGRWSPGGTMIACGAFTTDIRSNDEEPGLNIIDAFTGRTIRRIDWAWCYGFWYK